MQKTLGWDPILDEGRVIGLVEPTGQGAISLEPGGQFELSGAPLETIHQTCREGNAHLAQLREIAEPSPAEDSEALARRLGVSVRRVQQLRKLFF